MLLTSKLIDGTFPEYERVIPRGNDKVLRVGKKDFADAVGRVAAIPSERSRAGKPPLARDLLVLSASSPNRAPRPRNWTEITSNTTQARWRLAFKRVT